MGVILYELITLKKPFDSDTINGVFDKIVKSPIEPLAQNVDSSLKMLVAAILNKDYNKRPTIFDVAQIPCVKKHIIKFVDDHNLREEVMSIFDFDGQPKDQQQSIPQDVDTVDVTAKPVTIETQKPAQDWTT